MRGGLVVYPSLLSLSTAPFDDEGNILFLGNPIRKTLSGKIPKIAIGNYQPISLLIERVLFVEYLEIKFFTYYFQVSRTGENQL